MPYPVATMAAPVRVTCLGRFAVETSPGIVAGPWGRPVARRLVAILVLRPTHRATREQLAEWLVPNLSPTRAANAISKALTMARAALEPVAPAWLAADRSHVWLAPTVSMEVDLDQHQARLRAALAMPGGPGRDHALATALQEERPLLDDEPYAVWATAPRDQVEALRQEARLERARGRSRPTDPVGLRACVDAWGACLLHDPACEEAAIGLMAGYTGQGQRDLAIRTYHRSCAALEELGLRPSAALARAHASILAAPPPDPDPPVPMPAASPRPPPAPGRDGELRRLLGWLRAARDGRGPTCLIAGPAGIGKSHLVQVVAGRLEGQGWTVTTAAAMPDDRRRAFAALRMALATLANPAGDAPRRLDRLLGRAVPPAGPDPLTSASAPALLALEVATLLDTASRTRPVLVAIDDVHWADSGLHGVLARLAARPGPRRWALLLAARADEPRAPVPNLPPGTMRVDLPPLPPPAVSRIVRRAAGPGQRLTPSEVATIGRRSQGNPFFAVELARAAADDRGRPGVGAGAAGSVPDSIVDLLRDRLQRATADARRLLPMVALADEEATYELLLRLGAAAGVPAARTVRALDQLVGDHLLVEVPEGLRLPHPRLREAALAEVTALRRAALHERIADELERLGPGWGDMRVEAAARHRLLAFESGRLRSRAAAAATAAFGAGQRARALLAGEVAIALLEGGRAAYEALDVGEQARLRPQAVAAAVALGDTLLDGNRTRRAEAAYRWGLRLATGDEERGRLWSAIGGVAYRHGDMAAAALAYERGLAELQDRSPIVRGRLLADLGWARSRQARPAEALTLYQTAAPFLEDSHDPLDMVRLLDRMAVALNAVGRVEEGLRASDRALAAAGGLGSERERAALHIHRAGLLAARRDHERARVQAAEAVRIARASGDLYLESVGHWTLAQSLDALGDAPGALEERDRELALLDAIDNPRNVAGNQAHRAGLLLALGRVEASRAAGRLAREAARRTADPALLARVEAVLGKGVPAG